MVFAWHFVHGENGHPVPFEFAPAVFPLSLLCEGHTGVALFMTLSGYLFAKLLDGKSIDFEAFFLNRVLRLLPLLTLVLLAEGVRRASAGGDLDAYLSEILEGAYLPTLPCGGWSITVEFHFYLILPVFLWLLRKSRFLPLAIVAGAVMLRSYLRSEQGEIQSLAFWTIVGRIDQFALGMLMFHFRALVTQRHALVVALLFVFSLCYWYFDSSGGFYRIATYPSPSRIWIILPTIEGLAYAIGIAWYDSSFSPKNTGVSRFIGRIGAYSYSIYLLHFFVVFRLATFVDQHVMRISNFYVACLWAALCFLLMLPAGYLSFRFVESPFLKLRRSYLKTPQTAP
jgi:peptidoglycan/LPS O-acetylase OafA/YrhL